MLTNDSMSRTGRMLTELRENARMISRLVALVLAISGCNSDGTETSGNSISEDNTAPVVEAGPNDSITLPETAYTLQGSATDDGQPSAALNYSWSQVSGPGTVTFGDAHNPATAVTAPPTPG